MKCHPGGIWIAGTVGRLDRVMLRADRLAVGHRQGNGTADKPHTDTALADETQTLLTQANEAMQQQTQNRRRLR